MILSVVAAVLAESTADAPALTAATADARMTAIGPSHANDGAGQ